MRIGDDGRKTPGVGEPLHGYFLTRLEGQVLILGIHVESGTPVLNEEAVESGVVVGDHAANSNGKRLGGFIRCKLADSLKGREMRCDANRFSSFWTSSF